MASVSAALPGSIVSPSRNSASRTWSSAPRRLSLASLDRAPESSSITCRSDSCVNFSSSRGTFLSGEFQEHGPGALSRREALLPAVIATILASPLVPRAAASEASSEATGSLPLPKKVFVAGGTGQTGRRIVQSLVKRGVKVQAGVRSIEKAKELFSDLDPSLIDYVEFDVLKDPSTLSAAVDPTVDAVIVATGFSPQPGEFPNLLLPWQVDCEGTKHIVDAARKLGIGRLVLVSSLLTNGAAWGQAFNPNYILLNLFGLILIAKLQAEQYIQNSGINYTIVRPGGLRNDPPKGAILASNQDTLGAGSISRDSVAEVAVEALLWKEASYKIVEIVEEVGAPNKAFEELFAAVR